ncbi:unnamed protein product [Jaminaea pallidilutea]
MNCSNDASCHIRLDQLGMVEPHFALDSQSSLSALLDRTGYLLPALAISIIYLLVKYPNRLVGTKPRRDGVYDMPGWPLIGNTLTVIRRGPQNQFHNLLADFRRFPLPSYSWTFWPVGRLVFINRPEYLEFVQKTHFENYPKGALLRDTMSDLLGETGIFVADGHPWKMQRKMASHIFSVNQFRNIVQVVVHEELRSIAALLQNLTKGSHSDVIELPELFYRFTLSSFTKIAFGHDIGCLTSSPSSLETAVPFAVAFDKAQNHVNRRFSLPWWQVWEKFNQSGRDMRGCVSEMRSFALQIIHERLAADADEKAQPHVRNDSGIADLGTDDSGAKRPKDLLGLFMDLTKEPEDLLIVVLNFLIAGRDTTAQALSWLFIELMAHPEHVPIMRQEMESVVGPSSASQPALLDYDSVKDLPYTHACLSEALRLHPPVAKNSKRVVNDDVIVPQGPNPEGLPPVKVYAGEYVAWSDWVMARTEAVWGDDCEEFRPTRFLTREDESKGVSGWKYLQHSQWKFHAFNGGPRRCLGEPLAVFEALSFLTAVLPHYDFQWATDKQGQTTQWPPRYTPSVTLPCQPYKAMVARASS